jgi:hypothetical protein
MFTFTSTNSAIFKYFHRTGDGDAAKCVFCKKVLLCKGSSSKGLWTHLKSMHNEKYVKFKRKLEAIKVIEGLHLKLFKFCKRVIGKFWHFFEKNKHFPDWSEFQDNLGKPVLKNSDNPEHNKFICRRMQ